MKKIRVQNNTRRILQGEDLILSVGVQHSSNVTPDGNHMLHYIWTKDGERFGNEEGDLNYHEHSYSREWWSRPTIKLQDIRPDDAGTYQCEVSNHFGSVLTDPIAVEVVALKDNPLLNRNIVINGDQRQGDTGWSIIEGHTNSQQRNPYFWDSRKKVGNIGRDVMDPKCPDVLNEDIYVPPKDGDRLIGPFRDISGEGEVRMQQEISLVAIQDVIDRTVEGVTSVNISLGAWMGSPRFHPHSDTGFRKENKDNIGPSFRRAVARNYNEQGTYNSGRAFRIYWHLRNYFINDKTEIRFSFLNDMGDIIQTTVISSVPNSYMQSMMPLKFRKVGVPIGSRSLRVTMTSTREGRRNWDGYQWDVEIYKLMYNAVWGVNARISVNDEYPLGRFNPNFKHWHVHPPNHINPSVINYLFSKQADVFEWANTHGWYKESQIEEIDGDSGLGMQIHWTMRNNAKYRWIGTPANGCYLSTEDTEGRDRSVPVSNNTVKSFDLFSTDSLSDLSKGGPRYTGTDSGTYDNYWVGDNLEDMTQIWDNNAYGDNEENADVYFGRMITIYDAACAALNTKITSITWLYDFNLLRMDEFAEQKIIFTYGAPDFPQDSQTLVNVLSKRRKLNLHDDYSLPSIIQELRVEDIDPIIFDIHSSTPNFRPAQTRDTIDSQGAWEWMDWDEGGTTNDWDYLECDDTHFYKPFWYLFTSATPDTNDWQESYGSWREFIRLPREHSRLKECYWALQRVWWSIAQVYEESDNDYYSFTHVDYDCREWEDARSAFHNYAKVEEIYNALQIATGIPEEKFLQSQDIIKNWIKRRVVQHIMNCAFRAMAARVWSRQRRKDPWFIPGTDEDKPKPKTHSENYYDDPD